MHLQPSTPQCILHSLFPISPSSRPGGTLITMLSEATSPPVPQEATLTLRHRNTHPAASAALPALWGARCCQFHLLGTETQAVRLSCSNRLPEGNTGPGGHSDTQSTMTSAKPLLWGAQPGCGTKSTTQKEKFRTVQAGFQPSQAKTHSRLLGFHLGLKPTVPDSRTQTAPCSVPGFHTRQQRGCCCQGQKTPQERGYSRC